MQLVFVESINKFVVTPDEASASVLTGDEAIAEGTADAPTIRGEVELLLEEAVLDVRPEEEGCSCCHGGMLSLLLSKRFASSKEMRFLLEINCLAENGKEANVRLRTSIDFTFFNRGFPAFECT